MSTKHTFPTERINFGKGISRWCHKNEWPQSITEKVAKSLGLPGGPWASQISTAINGKLDPKPNFFIALGVFNKIIAEKKFKKIQDRILLDKLKDSIPFCHDDGRPFDGSDFFRLFTGLIPLPKEYSKEQEELTDEFCLKYGRLLETTFNAIGHDLMLSPKDTWKALAKTKGFPKNKDYQTVCKDILRGAHELTKEEALSCLELAKGECPCYTGLSYIANDPENMIDISPLERENQRLHELAST